jgi:hypothetical protein
LNVGGGAVPEPSIELGLVFQLLAAQAGDDHKTGGDLGKGGQVTPELLELGDWEDVFLAIAPAFFDLLQSDVGGEAGSELADGDGDLFPSVFVSGLGRLDDILAIETEDGEEAVDVDPGGHGIVEAELELVLLARHGETFHESGAAVDAGEAAAAVFEATGDDLEREAGIAFEVGAEEGGVGIGTDGIDVVKHQVPEVGTFAQKSGESSVAKEIGNLEEVPDRMEALEGEIVGIIGGFAGAGGPLDEGVAEAFADFLLLFVEALLGHFLPLEAEVAFGGNEAEAHGTALGQEERAGITVVVGAFDKAFDRRVGEVAGGEDVGRKRA